MRIFIVDDDPSILEVMKIDLALQDHQIDVFTSPLDALTAASRVRPDLLVVDLQMPDFGGLDLLALLEARCCAPRAGSLLLTSDCDRQTLARARRLGVVGLVSKPFTRADLIAAIDGVPKPTKEALPTLPASPEKPNTAMPLRILTVEDSLANRELISVILGDWGHIVVTASTGAEGLELLDIDSFDVALVDLRLPDIDGADVIRWLREAERDGRRARLRILAISADVSARASKEAVAAGADHYIEKPFLPRDLIAAVEGGRCANVAPDATAFNAGLTHDRTLLVSRVGVKAADRILSAFAQQVEDFLALGARSSATTEAAAHSMRGIASMIGFSELALRCQQLESGCRTGIVDPNLLKTLRASALTTLSQIRASTAIAA